MTVAEGPPIPAEATGATNGRMPRTGIPTPEALSVADQIEGKQRATPNIVDIDVEGHDGLQLRLNEGTDISEANGDVARQYDEAGTEFTWARRVVKRDFPAARTRFVDLVKEHPNVRGVIRRPGAPVNSNFKVTATPEREVVIINQRVKESLGDRAAEVYRLVNQIRFVYPGQPVSPEGSDISLERSALVIRHALLGLGFDEQLVDRGLSKDSREERVAEALAKILREGVLIDGIQLKVDWRVDGDDVDENEPIRVRRPKRKNIIVPRDQLKQNSIAEIRDLVTVQSPEVA